MAYVSSIPTEETFTAAATATPVLPDHVTGDLLLICLTQDGAATTITTATSGWAMIGTQAASGGSRTAWAWKIAASGAEPDPTFSGSTDEWISTIFVVKDADATTTIDVNNRTDYNNPASGLVTSGTPTTTTDNCLLFYSYGYDGVPQTILNPEDLYIQSVLSSGTAGHVIGTRNQYTAGAVPAITALQNLATEGGNVWVIAITNSTGGSLPGETSEVMDVISYAVATANINIQGVGTISALSTVAATIGGITASTTAMTASGGTITSSGRYAALRLTTSTAAVSEYQGAVFSFTARDFTNATLNFLIQCAQAKATTRYGGGFGMGLIVVDSTGNWVAYELINYAKMTLASLIVAMKPGEGTLLDSSGTLDITSINRIGFFTRRTATTNLAGLLDIKYITRQTGAVLIGGSASRPARYEDLYYGTVFSIASIGNASFQGSGQILTRCPVQIGDGTTPTFFSAIASSLELPKEQQSLATPVYGASFLDGGDITNFTIRAAAGDVIDFSSSIVACSSAEIFTIHASSSTSATYNFLGCSIVGYTVLNNVVGIIFNGATFNSTRGITLNGGSMIGCIVTDSLNTPAVTTNNPENILDTAFTSAGTGHAIEITTPGVYDFTGNSFTGYGADTTTDAAIYNNSGGAVELIIPTGDDTPTVRNGAGASTTITQPTNNQSVTLTGGVANSRVQLYDLTSNTELANQIVATFPFTWTDAVPYVADRQIRLRVAYQNGATAKVFIDQVIGTATNASPAIPFLINQEDDEVYIANAIDGSTVTGIVIDDTAFLVEIDTGTTTWAGLYAYETYWLYTSAGIQDEGRFIVARDTANYIFYDFQIKNVTSPSVPLTITGAWARDSVTGQTETLIDTAGGTIFSNPDLVISYAVGSGVTPADITAIADAVAVDLTIVNENVKKASLLIPATQDL